MILVCARTKILNRFCVARTCLSKEYVNFNKHSCKQEPYLANTVPILKKWHSTKDEKDRVYTIPNLLCVGRIVVCPYLYYAIINGDYKTSLIVYSIAGFTDLVRMKKKILLFLK